MSRRYAVEVGDIVWTSYGTGPYVVREIERDCTCYGLFDNVKTEPHMHLVCTLPGHRGDFYLNGYTEELSCVWSDDTIRNCGPAAGTQRELF